MGEHDPIIERSRRVIDLNDHGVYTVPNHRIFGDSQFLWDSAQVAEAMAYYDPERAATEILSLFRGQKPNGMIPNETIVNSGTRQRAIFGTERSTDGITASGITQPPIIAQAALAISNHMSESRRQAFLKQAFEPLKNYHEWLLSERVVDDTGLVTLIHPYESGMDNLPPWREALHDHWLGDDSLSGQAKEFIMSRVVGVYRRVLADGKHVPLDQRADNHDVLSSFLQTRKIASHNYHLPTVWEATDIPVQQDVGFNALFAEANQSLLLMAAIIDDPHYVIEPELLTKMNRLKQSLDTVLWHEELDSPARSGFYNRDPRTGKLIVMNTVGGLLPLVAELDDARRDFLVARLFDEDQFWSPNPVPAVALNDPEFHETAYWRGVSWPFIRVILERALSNNGLASEAHELRIRTLQRKGEPVKSEYEHPINGEPLGISEFTPTAAQDIIFASKEHLLKKSTKRLQ